MNINILAKLILGDKFGGPSLSYDSKKREFLVYSWTCASETEFGRGKTVKEAIEKALVNLEKERDAKQKLRVFGYNMSNIK